MLIGKSFIGSERSGDGNVRYYGVNPAAKEQLETAYIQSTEEEISVATAKAVLAYEVYRYISGQKKADFLDVIADEILALGDALLERSSLESGLPLGRVTSERGRTIGQMRLFAQLLRTGEWVGARIDPAIPDRTPMPRVDLRSMERPVGPVGVFGASNFPLAFSVAGGDTASALAAGCPVIVKAHPAHPGTCELIASAIIKAAATTNMPEGVFSMIQGPSIDVGMALVSDPRIKAIGFTGSHRGGKAIFGAAAARSEPIPVYAEMGSTNPVFILPQALENRGDIIATGLAGSITMGVGQFCTNPGLVVRITDRNATSFDSQLSTALEGIAAGTMLTSDINAAYAKGIERLNSQSDVDSLLEREGSSADSGHPNLFATTVKSFCNTPDLEEEVFGPSSVIVRADNKEELLKVASQLSGHLTATLIGEESELVAYRDLIEILETKVGRLVINGYPTGVEVCHAMVHGGPYPATTDSRSTSVGTGAITRFTRPVCYQNFPDALLPDELKQDNPLGISRMVKE